MPNTIKEWIELIVPIASLMVTFWAALISWQAQRSQYKAAMAANAPADTIARRKMKWFKQTSSGFWMLALMSGAWIFIAALSNDPVTRLTLLQFSLLSIGFILCIFIIAIIGIAASLAPSSFFNKPLPNSSQP